VKIQQHFPVHGVQTGERLTAFQHPLLDPESVQQQPDLALNSSKLLESLCQFSLPRGLEIFDSLRQTPTIAGGNALCEVTHQNAPLLDQKRSFHACVILVQIESRRQIGNRPSQSSFGRAGSRSHDPGAIGPYRNDFRPAYAAPARFNP
jgi:hypothetical protein